MNMKTGIRIKFHKKCNQFFENEWDNDIRVEFLILALLETINDICKENDLDTNKQLLKYIKLGSIDNYVTAEEKEKMRKLGGK